MKKRKEKLRMSLKTKAPRLDFDRFPRSNLFTIKQENY